MSASARRSVISDVAVTPNGRSNRAGQATSGLEWKRPDANVAAKTKLSIFVAADNRLLRETLGHMLEVTGPGATEPLQAESIAQTNADVLLLTSRGMFREDLLMIRRVRAAAPEMRILLLGKVKDEREFLQCVRAGISGYLPHDASSSEVLEGVRAVLQGRRFVRARCVRRCSGILKTKLHRWSALARDEG